MPVQTRTEKEPKDYELDIIVDAQGDNVGVCAPAFITAIAERLETIDHPVIFLMDTHHLGLKSFCENADHCIYGGVGWLIAPEIRSICNPTVFNTLMKDTYGPSGQMLSKMVGENPDVINIYGYYLDTSVLATAFIVQSIYPKTRVVVHKSLSPCMVDTAYLDGIYENAGFELV